MNHFRELADRMEANPEAFRQSPGDVWGTSDVKSRIAFYRLLADQQDTSKGTI